MSNLPTPVDPEALAAVLGGRSRTSTSTSSISNPDSWLQTLTSLSKTLKDIGNTANKTGFSTTDILLLGLLFNQNRSPNVIVRPFW
jgi:hypothetical protein